MNPEETCPECSLSLSKDHSCIKSISELVRSSSSIVKENDELITSQNILLAKMIRDSQEMKDEMDQIKVDFQAKVDLLTKQVEELSKTSKVIDEPILVYKVSKQHKELIDKLRTEGHIKSEKVYQVMCSVDFRNFGDDFTNSTWVDCNSINLFKTTISH